jgi:hypothetical protein
MRQKTLAAAWYKKNKKRLKAKWARPKTKKRTRTRMVKWRAKNKNRRAAYQATWKAENKKRVQEYVIRYRPRRAALFAARYVSDPQFCLAQILRSRLRSALSSKTDGSFVRDLGCSIPKFMVYIEKLFWPGMTWGNRGRKGWHLDHKIPLSSFDLTDRRQFLKACHYTNCQPLWGIHNLQKSDRLNWQPPSRDVSWMKTV